MSSRRREVRFDLAFPVLAEGIFGIAFCGARNVSAGGIFLETLDLYPIGSHLAITFELPGGGATIVARGEVKHAVRFEYADRGARRSIRGVGVKFVAFEAGDV